MVCFIVIWRLCNAYRVCSGGVDDCGFFSLLLLLLLAGLGSEQRGFAGAIRSTVYVSGTEQDDFQRSSDCWLTDVHERMLAQWICLSMSSAAVAAVAAAATEERPRFIG